MILLNLCFVILLSAYCTCSKPHLQRQLHRSCDLSDNDIRTYAGLSNVAHFEKTLNEIIIPRVVGTPNHSKVKSFIIKELKNLGFHVETDKFRDEAPILGELEFENIIAKLNPHASRYVVLACHFDSKYFANETFYGATDSAVPCAMMLNLVQILNPYFNRTSDVSLELIFFDGEEAFKEWGPTDSIYGSRHLAAKWQNTPSPVNNKETELDRIDLFILLDLLGAPNPTFYSMFKETEHWFFRLARLERKLNKLGLLQPCAHCRNNNKVYFQPTPRKGGIEDDHVPFLQRGVPILHLIVTPFPTAWHTPGDDRASLDMNTIENLNKIFRLFIIEYLHLK